MAHLLTIVRGDNDPEDSHLARIIRLAAIVECAYDAIIAMDSDGVIHTWNPAAERVFGYTECEMTGRNIDVLCPPRSAGDDARVLERIRRGERVEPCEVI